MPLRISIRLCCLWLVTACSAATTPGEECQGNACDAAVCGDGTVTAPEACDGYDLAGSTCTGEGFDGGTVRCTDTCELDLSGCARCGDGQIGAGEACDGASLAGQDCLSAGYTPAAPSVARSPAHSTRAPATARGRSAAMAPRPDSRPATVAICAT